MPSCAVSYCKNFNTNTKGTDIKYFSFPRNEDMAKQWIAACKRSDKVNLKNACVCSIHFALNCFEIPLKQRLLQYTPKNSRHLKPDAVPTLNLSLNSDIPPTVKYKKGSLSPIEKNECKSDSNNEELKQNKTDLVKCDLPQLGIEANRNYNDQQ